MMCKSVESVMQMNHQECLSRLLSFTAGYERVFLYGAGFYGDVCYKYLSRHGIKVTGFIVSETSKLKDKDGVPIYILQMR